MAKIIAAMNMTLDGFCDHTSGVVDEALHRHYADLLKNAGALLYGRKTFELMEYWRQFVNNPSGDAASDEFAIIMDRTPKIIFSRSMKNTDWHSAQLSDKELEDKVDELRALTGKDILVGSPGLIAALAEKNLLDELQICIHPLLSGNGLVLFKGISAQKRLALLETKTFGSGVVLLRYGTCDQANFLA